MDNLEYIDRYFNNTPAPEEIKEFEKRLLEDAAFAQEVTFYMGAWQAAKMQAAEEKKRRFTELYDKGNPGSAIKPVKQLWRYMAAAAVISGIVFGWYVFFQPPSAQKMAGRYISEHFKTLGVTMGSSPDTLQNAIRLFNEGKLQEALQRFETIAGKDTSDFLAVQYAGISALRLKELNKALSFFQKLESFKDLHANPAKFYQAITYLNRNREGDEEIARQLLQQVVAGDLEGRETASRWLSRM